MTIAEAKKISICSYLKAADDKAEVWIKSPFNPNEKTPSFKIHTIKNIWYDHSQGFGGTIIDLVKQLHNLSTSDALRHLSSSSDNLSFSPVALSFSPAKKEDSQKQTITKIQSLQNPALIKYLKTRKINIRIAAKYLQEIYYSQNDKRFFALAFKSDAGGYEIRNAHFKGCIGTKSITTIQSQTPTNKVSIFEGFMDFLSALTYYKTAAFKNDVIVLNSAALVNTLEINSYEVVYLFLDNDKAGQKAKNTLFDKNKNCVDCSKIYENHKDFNEFIL